VKKWLLSTGIGVYFAPESVSVLNQNRCLLYTGICI